MTDSDLDYGDRIGHELRDTSSHYGPPLGLYPRVTQLERQHRRRRAGVRAGALGLAAVATVGGVASTREARTNETRVASHPAPAALGLSASVDRIDAYPIIDWPADPIPGVGASYRWHDDDQGWGGTVAVPQPGGAPTSIIAIHVFPAGWDTPFPDTTPGRIAGVEETSFANGHTTLAWKVGDVPVVVSGENVDLLYQLIDIVQPIEATPQRGGYQFNGPLPGRLIEVEAPYHRIPMREPSLSTDDGTFGITVAQGALLTTLAGGGYSELEAISINGLAGYQSTREAAVIALALSTDETLYLYAQDLSLAQLTEIAEHVTITDETTWRARYQPH